MSFSNSPIPYLAARIIRQMVPAPVISFLIRHHIGMSPGPEAASPEATVNRYLNVLNENGRPVQDKTVMIFGYGGVLGCAAGLLKAGARQVLLCDPHVRLSQHEIRNYCNRFPAVFSRASPNGFSKQITIVSEPFGKYLESGAHQADIVLSCSVLEHVRDVNRSVCNLASITSPRGIHIHFIDLRDHFFRYPFEMLTFSSSAWNRLAKREAWVNRIRIQGYREIFFRYFGTVQTVPTETDRDSFGTVRSRICPEFISGDDRVDAATGVLLVATRP